MLRVYTQHMNNVLNYMHDNFYNHKPHISSNVEAISGIITMSSIVGLDYKINVLTTNKADN